MTELAKVDMGEVGMSLEELSCQMEEQELEQNEGGMEKTDTSFSPIVSQILGAEEMLKDIDDYFNDLPNLQSQVDEELSDLLHYIENNNLSAKECAKMIKLIKQKRLIRRGLCNDYEIKKTYNTHRNKLAIETQRPFFLMEIRKTASKLNQQYRYRRFGLEVDDTQERKVLAEKEIKKLLK